jgi:transcriptional regulator with XRE-family HTH domain
MKDIAKELGIDASLMSRFENGERKPTKAQVIKIAEILGIDSRKMLIDWMSESIIKEYGYDKLAFDALIAAESKVAYIRKNKSQNSSEIESILAEIELWKSKIDKFRQFDSYRIAQALELEYTFESNRIEGNTMTLRETDLVINEGITIAGKSMREHLEAINHNDAIVYLKELAEKKSDFKERDLLQLHYLVLKGIDGQNAGKYRNVQVMIKGSKHMPPQPFLVKNKWKIYFTGMFQIKHCFTLWFWQQS